MNKDLIEETYMIKHNSGCGVKGCGICDTTANTILGEYAKQQALKKKREKRALRVLWAVIIIGFILGLLFFS